MRILAQVNNLSNNALLLLLICAGTWSGWQLATMLCRLDVALGGGIYLGKHEVVGPLGIGKMQFNLFLA